jgi:hypothetical protein
MATPWFSRPWVIHAIVTQGYQGVTVRGTRFDNAQVGRLRGGSHDGEQNDLGVPDRGGGSGLFHVQIFHAGRVSVYVEPLTE